MDHVNSVAMGVLPARMRLADLSGWPLTDDLMPLIRANTRGHFDLGVFPRTFRRALAGGTCRAHRAGRADVLVLVPHRRNGRRAVEHHEISRVDDGHSNADLPFVLRDRTPRVVCKPGDVNGLNFPQSCEDVRWRSVRNPSRFGPLTQGRVWFSRCSDARSASTPAWL